MICGVGLAPQALATLPAVFGGLVLVGVLGFELMYLANAVVLVACGVYLFAMRIGPLPEPAPPAERLPTPEGIVPP